MPVAAVLRPAAAVPRPRHRVRPLGCGVLCMVVGAPGAGKTAVTGALRAGLPGTVVLDMDEFLDAGSALAGLDLREQAAAARWPAYGALCLALVGAVVEAGVDVVLLTPLNPAEVDATAGRARLGPIDWAVLDCPDESRRDRLAHRPMDDPGIRSAIEDARQLRGLGLPILESSGTVAAAAATVTAWVLSRS